MKKVALIAISLVSAVISYGQGTFDLNNLSQNGGLGSPVTISGGPSDGRFTGSEFIASLYWGVGTVADAGSLSLYNTANWAFFGTTASGGPTIDGAGLFDAGNPIIQTAPGTVTVQVRVTGLPGGSYEGYFGDSALYQVVLVDPTGVTPRNGLPTFAPFTVAVPEPSTFALAGLGVAALLAFRRRK